MSKARRALPAQLLLVLLLACGEPTPRPNDAEGPGQPEPTPEAEPEAEAEASPEPEPAPCPEGEFLGAGGCAPLTQCGDGQFEAQAPTATSDRRCAEIRVCVDGEVEVQAPTPESDRICEVDPRPDYEALTQGVGLLGTGEYPGSLIIHGPWAFSVASLDNGSSFIAASRLEGGRVVAFGKDGYTNGGWESRGEDLRQLILNAARWAARVENPVVGVQAGRSALQDALSEAGLQVVEASPADLDGVDVFFGHSSDGMTPEAIEALRAHCRVGGGLVLEGNPWAYASYVDGQDFIHRYPGNSLLNAAGLTWVPDYTWPTQGERPIAPALEPLHNANSAIDALLRHQIGREPLSPDALALGVQTVRMALRYLTLDFDHVHGALAALREGLDVPWPSQAQPFEGAQDPIGVVLLEAEIARTQQAPAAELGAHPASADFPGAVADDAPRVTRAVTLQGDNGGWPDQRLHSGAGSKVWRSTGLYAPPGAILTVTIPEVLVGAGLEAQIGAHTDRLDLNGTLHRFPSIARSWPLAQPRQEVGNAFGGLIYVALPPGSRLGEFEVTIEGAVEAARFVRGETTIAQWAQERLRPAPWAELDAGALILTVPAESAAALNDPTEIVDFWGAVMAHGDALAGVDRRQGALRPERIVTDRQISAGYMHSGYPIMGHLDQADAMLDVATMRINGNWGPFHEIGHNYQWRDWLLPGTTESSCNLWSVYISERHLGIPRGRAHEAIAPRARFERLNAYVRGGRDFANEWSVWTALQFYLELQEAFGWEPYQDIFADYLTLEDAQRPADNDIARIDAWLVRTSERVGHDLGPFFQAWALPASSAALARVDGLPDWTHYSPLLPGGTGERSTAAGLEVRNVHMITEGGLGQRLVSWTSEDLGDGGLVEPDRPTSGSPSGVITLFRNRRLSQTIGTPAPGVAYTLQVTAIRQGQPAAFSFEALQGNLALGAIDTSREPALPDASTHAPYRFTIRPAANGGPITLIARHEGPDSATGFTAISLTACDLTALDGQGHCPTP